MAGHHLGRRRRRDGSAVVGDHLELIVCRFNANGVHIGDVGTERALGVEGRDGAGAGHVQGDAQAEFTGELDVGGRVARRDRQGEELIVGGKILLLHALHFSGAPHGCIRHIGPAHRRGAVGKDAANARIRKTSDGGVRVGGRIHDVRPV
jgi:hypothetical protein